MNLWNFPQNIATTFASKGSNFWKNKYGLDDNV